MTAQATAPGPAGQQAASSTSGQMQSNGAATGIALLGAVVTTVASFGVALLIATVSARFAGVFFAATAVVTILGNSTGLGTMTGLVYFLPNVLADAEPNPRALLRLAFGPVLAFSSFVALALALAADPLARAIAEDGATDVKAMLRILAVAVPFWAITVTSLGATRGLGSVTPTVVVNQLVRPFAQLGLVGGLLLLDRHPSAEAVALAWGLPVVGASFVALAAVGRLGGFAADGTASVSRSEFWHYTRPRALSTSCQIALERVDVILVSAFAGEAAAGIYGTVTRFITAGNFLIFAMGQATSSGLRRALAAGNHDRAQRLLRQSTGWMVLVAWPYFLLVATKAEPLAALVHPSFAVGATPLAILAVVTMASAFAGPVDLTLLMLGRSRWSLTATALALTVDLLVAWWAIPRFGLTGAAVAWGLAVVTQNGLASLLVYRIGRLSTVARPSLVAACGALLAVVPAGLLTANSLVGLVAAGGIGGILLTLWVARFAPILDLDLGPLPAIRSRLGW